MMECWSCVRILVICALYHFPLGGCQLNQGAVDLLEELFVTRSYNKKLGPIFQGNGEVLDVIVKFYLFSINSLDEASETLKITGTLNFQWMDAGLEWDKDDYAGIDSIYLPQDDVWLPDISLQNSIGEYKALGAKSLKVQLQADGTIFWAPFQVFESTCSINIKYFPFDTQNCQLKFVSWSYSTQEVNIKNMGNGAISLHVYKENASWKLLKTAVFTDNVEDDQVNVIFTLTLQRKPSHALLSLVLPVFVLSLLNLTVFLLPSESGEKSGYAMTLFLAIIVFLSIFATMLPNNSDTISILSIYVSIQTLQSMLITFMTVISIRLSAFDESTPVPRVCFFFGKLVRCNICRKKCTPRRRQSNKVDNSGDAISDYKEESAGDEPSETYTWKHVTNDLDILCTIFFTACFVISTCVCYFEASTSKQTNDDISPLIRR